MPHSSGQTLIHSRIDFHPARAFTESMMYEVIFGAEAGNE